MALWICKEYEFENNQTSIKRKAYQYRFTGKFETLKKEITIQIKFLPNGHNDNVSKRRYFSKLEIHSLTHFISYEYSFKTHIFKTELHQKLITSKNW